MSLELWRWGSILSVTSHCVGPAAVTMSKAAIPEIFLEMSPAMPSVALLCSVLWSFTELGTCTKLSSSGNLNV